MTADLRDAIVDAALELAERTSWEAVRLYEVAALLGITLEDVRQHFREKEDVVDAWFDRADRAMLCTAQAPHFRLLASRERLHLLMTTWFDALSARRRVTRQMIYGKFEPGHLHIQIPGAMRVSRTVQWMREAAERNATYVRRALEETVLTSIYLTTFFHWLNDDTPGGARTRRLLDALLDTAERVDSLFGAPQRGVRRVPIEVIGDPAPQSPGRPTR